jgi:excisionase family DNA binding protein
MSSATLAVPIEHKVLYSRPEAAQLLGISVPLLDRLVAEGAIRFRRVGGPIRGRVLFHRSELESFAQGKTFKG